MNLKSIAEHGHLQHSEVVVEGVEHWQSFIRLRLQIFIETGYHMDKPTFA